MTQDTSAMVKSETLDCVITDTLRIQHRVRLRV